MTTTHELVTFLHETADEVERLRDLPHVRIDMDYFCSRRTGDDCCHVCLAGVHLYKMGIFEHPSDLTGIDPAVHPKLWLKLYALDALRRDWLNSFAECFPGLDPEFQAYIAKYHGWSRRYAGALSDEEIDALIDDVRRFANYVEEFDAVMA